MMIVWAVFMVMSMLMMIVMSMLMAGASIVTNSSILASWPMGMSVRVVMKMAGVDMSLSMAMRLGIIYDRCLRPRLKIENRRLLLAFASAGRAHQAASSSSILLIFNSSPCRRTKFSEPHEQGA